MMAALDRASFKVSCRLMLGETKPQAYLGATGAKNGVL
jgi:hypothetical protein